MNIKELKKGSVVFVLVGDSDFFVKNAPDWVAGHTIVYKDLVEILWGPRGKSFKWSRTISPRKILLNLLRHRTEQGEVVFVVNPPSISKSDWFGAEAYLVLLPGYKKRIAKELSWIQRKMKADEVPQFDVSGNSEHIVDIPDTTIIFPEIHSDISLARATVEIANIAVKIGFFPVWTGDYIDKGEDDPNNVLSVLSEAESGLFLTGNHEFSALMVMEGKATGRASLPRIDVNLLKKVIGNTPIYLAKNNIAYISHAPARDYNMRNITYSELIFEFGLPQNYDRSVIFSHFPDDRWKKRIYSLNRAYSVGGKSRIAITMQTSLAVGDLIYDPRKLPRSLLEIPEVSNNFPKHYLREVDRPIALARTRLGVIVSCGSGQGFSSLGGRPILIRKYGDYLGKEITISLKGMSISEILGRSGAIVMPDAPPGLYVPENSVIATVGPDRDDDIPLHRSMMNSMGISKALILRTKNEYFILGVYSGDKFVPREKIGAATSTVLNSAIRGFGLKPGSWSSGALITYREDGTPVAY